MTVFKRIEGSQIQVPVQLSTGEDAWAWRTASNRIFTTQLDIPELPVEVGSDWVTDAGLFGPGDISVVRESPEQGWPEVQRVREALHAWAQPLGFAGATKDAPVTVLACMGASFHSDGDSYPDTTFCVVWLNPDVNLDLVFPHVNVRIPLRYGTAVLFDSVQPHGVVERGASLWDPDQFLAGRTDYSQVFLSWDLRATHEELARLMEIQLSPLEEDDPISMSFQINGVHGPNVNPVTGAWAC